MVLAARDGAVLPVARPGQHVVLRATISGQAVLRPYTLSGASGGPWEVTVKHLPGGALSEWLVRWAEEGTHLEASPPRGDVFWDGGPAPVVCFAAGIGITPGLAMLRTLLAEGWPHRLVLHLSVRTRRELALLGELSLIHI